MSDLKDRVGVLTGGNANLIVNPGDLITGDGNQTVYKRASTGADGLVLALDSTKEDGLDWIPNGSGSGLTFSDGVTKTLANVTNDLVTGTPVAEIIGLTSGNGDIQLAAAGTGGVLIDTTGGGSVAPNQIQILADAGVLVQSPAGAGKGFLVQVDAGGTSGQNPSLTMGVGGGGGLPLRATLSANDTRIIGDSDARIQAPSVQVLGGTVGANGIFNDDGIGIGIVDPATQGIFVDASGTLSVPVDGQLDLKATNDLNAISTAGNVAIAATLAGLTLTAGTAMSITAATGLITMDGLTVDINGANDLLFTLSRDELHTGGRDFGVTITRNASIEADGNVTLDAGSVDNTGEVRIMPTAGTPAVTKTFRIWDGAGGPQQAYVEATGGAVIDAEARTAILAISDALNLWGFFSAQT